MNKKEYEEKVKLLNKWANAYYTKDSPLASDEEYDLLYKEIVNFEEQNPNDILKFSPTRRVGDSISTGFEKIAHIKRMWSMEDIFNDGELKSWINRGNKNDIEFYCEPKFDGASLNLLYENGTLISAATRGDGLIGEDVTQNARVIKSIPLQIPYNKKIEIRGEVLISKDDFDMLNDERAQNGEIPLSNPRNAAAGSLRQLDSNIVKKRKLNFMPWDVGYNELGEFNKHSDVMEFVRNLGFLRDDFLKICSNAKEIDKAYKELHINRDGKKFLLDGMVIRINDLKLSKEFEYTVKFPKFIVAYKFPAVEKVTKLYNINLQVGRSGVITPVGVLEPVNIDGAIVKNATLHNFDEIDRLGLMKNDFVSIIRSGDVIPKITSVYKDRRDGSEVEIQRPTNCPVCNSILLDEGVFLKCQNIDCKARITNLIIYFSSKKCMNIDGLGKAIVKLLFEKNKISKIIDIYTLKYDDLKDLEGFKDKKILNLLNSIENSKKTPLERFITSLGIEHIGEVASRQIAQKFKENWINATLEELLNIDGFGETMAKSFVEFCKVNKESIKELMLFVQPIVKENKILNSIFNGRSIVLTGTLSKDREEIKEELIGLGAKVVSSVSQKTDFVLYGKEAGSKLQKAIELGVKTINEKEYQNLIDEL